MVARPCVLLPLLKALRGLEQRPARGGCCAASRASRTRATTQRRSLSADVGAPAGEAVAQNLAGDKRSAEEPPLRRPKRVFPPPPLPDPSSFAPSAASAYFHFEILHESKISGARVGRLHTPHGVCDTPGFVPVATCAALKCVDWAAADAVGTQLAFCNTFHLLLNPGGEVVQANGGGLHGFMNRHNSPLITDSGGFQVFSLQHGGVTESLAAGEASLKRAALRTRRKGSAPADADPAAPPPPRTSLVLKLSEEGVLFKSYRDGARIFLTPESSVATQKQLGADIILPLDELPQFHISAEELASSTGRSHRWMARSLAFHAADPRRQAMYAIVHGGTDTSLRASSADYLSALPFDGMAIGGALGRNREEMGVMLSALMPRLPRARPRHLLGIGDEASVRVAVALGCDTMDSSWPTRAGRHGTLFTSRGVIAIKKGVYERMHVTPDPECDCSVCATHTLAYLHHLYKAREPVLCSLAALHNLAYTHRLMRNLRADILHGWL